MRTSPRGGALAAALAVLSSTSQGANLTHKARIESVQLYGDQGFHFTYARNDLGRIMALGDELGLAGGDWANLGRPGGVIARAEGVAATFETWNNDVHVFAVGEDGRRTTTAISSCPKCR
jgi:hypothetical protein